MAHVVTALDAPSGYKDSQHRLDRQRQLDILSKSTTLYVRTTWLGLVAPVSNEIVRRSAT